MTIPNAMNKPSTPNSRRAFFNVNGENRQIFTISQNKNDASIYFSAPNFADINWLVPFVKNSDTPILLSENLGADGKLSLHGSGVSHIRPFDATGRFEFSISGLPLKNQESGDLSVRHLVTFYLPEPKSPGQQISARKSDLVFSSKEHHPWVMVFWAHPSFSVSAVEIVFKFKIEELAEFPPHSGWGAFTLALHTVVWLIYRTKHMDDWPLSGQACYLDGYVVPLLVGTGKGKFRLDLQRPNYSLSGTRLKIEL